jgi:hypothetical protein
MGRLVQLRIIVASVALFSAGYIVGRVFPAAGRPLAPPPSTAVADVSSVPVPEPFIPAEHQPTEVQRSAPDQLAMIARLNTQIQQKVRVSMLTIDQLNPDFVVWFGLTDAEVQQIEKLIASVREGLRALEAQHVVLEPSGDETINLRIAPFPEKGAEVFDRFQAQLAETMGPERYHYYRELSDYENLSSFGGFGLQTVQIQVSDQLDDNGRPRWTGSSRFDQEQGVFERNEHLPRQGLKINHPLIYQKLTAQGLIVED